MVDFGLLDIKKHQIFNNVSGKKVGSHSLNKEKNILHLFIQFSAKYFDRTRNSCDIFYSSTYQKCESDIFSIQTTQVVVEQTNQSSFTK